MSSSCTYLCGEIHLCVYNYRAWFTFVCLLGLIWRNIDWKGWLWSYVCLRGLRVKCAISTRFVSRKDVNCEGGLLIMLHSVPLHWHCILLNKQEKIKICGKHDRMMCWLSFEQYGKYYWQAPVAQWVHQSQRVGRAILLVRQQIISRCRPSIQQLGTIGDVDAMDKSERYTRATPFFEGRIESFARAFALGCGQQRQHIEEAIDNQTTAVAPREKRASWCAARLIVVRMVHDRLCCLKDKLIWWENNWVYQNWYSINSRYH